ncbi:unnamed protein product [Lampetra planeri]
MGDFDRSPAPAASGGAHRDVDRRSVDGGVLDAPTCQGDEVVRCGRGYSKWVTWRGSLRRKGLSALCWSAVMGFLPEFRSDLWYAKTLGQSKITAKHRKRKGL